MLLLLQVHLEHHLKEVMEIHQYFHQSLLLVAAVAVLVMTQTIIVQEDLEVLAVAEVDLNQLYQGTGQLVLEIHLQQLHHKETLGELELILLVVVEEEQELQEQMVVSLLQDLVLVEQDCHLQFLELVHFMLVAEEVETLQDLEELVVEEREHLIVFQHLLQLLQEPMLLAAVVEEELVDLELEVLVDLEL